MLSETQIYANKNRFLELIQSINREGANLELLERQLTQSDFFTAPASTKFHQSYEGGLCEHCLQVYDNLVKLNTTFDLKFNEDSMKIVALLHDFAKMNYYVSEVKNKKVYFPEGKKKDSMGNYDWVSEMGYGIKEVSNRFIFGNHEETCAFMANTFIPLTIEEYVAILHHHGGMGWDSTQDNIADYFHKYPLTMYLYMSDLVSANE